VLPRTIAISVVLKGATRRCPLGCDRATLDLIFEECEALQNVCLGFALVQSFALRIALDYVSGIEFVIGFNHNGINHEI